MMILAYVLVALLSSRGATRAATIGINWGRTSAQRLLPSTVVDLLLQNKIRAARVYSGEEDILKAFSGSGIRLNIQVYDFRTMGSDQSAQKWVKDRGPYFSSCNVRYVYIGSGVLHPGMESKDSLNTAIDAMERVQKALNEAGKGSQMKVTVTHLDTVLKGNWTRPSQAEFRDDIGDELARLIRVLLRHRSPFVIEMFPISYVSEHSLDPDFAFMDNKSKHVVKDVKGVYTNVIEFLIDSFAWALKKAGASDLEIVVGHVGWPTDGYHGANASSAERFYKSFLPWVASDRGTPMRPGPIDVYVHSLADENGMPFSHPFTRHWGIYTSNGEPKYKIDLTGQGRDVYPTMARGIMRMPKRWCVFNEDVTDVIKVKDKFDYACKNADCTNLAPGGSCSKLTHAQNVSYAFNVYFQSKFQNESECNFGGLGKLVTEDPSTADCIFPVEVVKGEQISGGENAEGQQFSGGDSGRDHVPECSAIFLLFLSIFWALVWS